MLAQSAAVRLLLPSSASVSISIQNIFGYFDPENKILGNKNKQFLQEVNHF